MTTRSILPEQLVRGSELAQKDPPALLGDAAEHRLPKRPRLLEDLLQHEVLVAGLLGHDRVPRDPLRRLADGAAGEVGERDAPGRDHGHLFVAEEHDVARVIEDGGDVRRDDELTVVADADDNRRPLAHRHDLVRIVGMDQHHPEQPAQPRERAADGSLEPVAPQLALYEMRDDLGVGFGFEPVPVAQQLLLQVEVVLDDAVVDEDDSAAAIAMRVGVLLRRPAVGGPSGMTDAVAPAVDRIRPDDLLEARELAGAAPHLDVAVAHERDAGRVVAAILEVAQRVDQHRDDRLGADVANDAAHETR